MTDRHDVEPDRNERPSDAEEDRPLSAEMADEAVVADGSASDEEEVLGEVAAAVAVADEQPNWEELAEADVRSRGELLAELTEAEARRDEYLEDVRRARAEFDNYRKRVMREGATQRDHGRTEVIGRLLEVLDDFDRTLEVAAASEDEGLAKGIALVHDKLVGALAGLGLERITDVGQPFDPARHEAVQQVAAEDAVAEPTVSAVLRPGYTVSGRVLRPAMVVVAQ